MIILCHPNNRPAVVEGFSLQGVTVNEDGTTSMDELRVQTVPYMNEKDSKGNPYILGFDEEQFRSNVDAILRESIPIVSRPSCTGLVKFQ